MNFNNLYDNSLSMDNTSSTKSSYGYNNNNDDYSIYEENLNSNNIVYLVIDHIKEAKTFDDSGWGHKSCSILNIKMYNNSLFSLEVRGTISIIDSFSQSTFITEMSTSINGEYYVNSKFKVDNNLNLNILKIIKNNDKFQSKYNVSEYILKPKESNIMSITKSVDLNGCEETNPPNHSSNLLEKEFKILIISNIDNNNTFNYILLFNNEAKDWIFCEYFTDPEWYYE